MAQKSLLENSSKGARKTDTYKVSKEAGAAIAEMHSWFADMDRGFTDLVFRLLASLPGGEALEDMGVETFGWLGWKEADLIGHLLSGVQDKHDVEAAVAALAGPHGDVLEVTHKEGKHVDEIGVVHEQQEEENPTTPKGKVETTMHGVRPRASSAEGLVRRYVGDAVVSIRYRDEHDDYAGTIVVGKSIWPFDGLRAPKVGLGEGVAYDSAKAYDVMAASAVGFGSYFTTHNRGDDVPEWAPAPEIADAIDEATSSVMDEHGNYQVLRKRAPSAGSRSSTRPGR